MRRLLHLLTSTSIAFTILIGSSHALAADFDDYNAFLTRLGFESYTAQAAKTLKEGDLNDLAVRNLEANALRYRVVDSARLLTLVIVEESFDRMNDPKVREKILNLTTYLLEPHPMMTREILPENIQSQSGEAYVKARYAYLRRKIYDRFWDEKLTLLAALADLAPKQETKDMDSLIHNYLVTKYTDFGLQQTRYWGRAMAASLVRYARLNGQPSLETDLNQQLLSKGIYLGNFLSSTVRYKDDHKQVVTVKIHNGDFVNEHARGSDAYFISIGVEPSDAKDRKFAEASNLFGSKWEIKNYLEPGEEQALIIKARDRGNLTASEKRHYAFIQSNPKVSGYSHVGMIEIKTDKESGIEMPWVWDMYPNSKLGGVRFIGLEGFAYTEKFRKIGFVHYDAKKFQQYYVEKTKAQGYLPIIWKSYGAGYSDAGKLVEYRKRTHDWPSVITAAEVQKLQSFPANQADAWYANEIVPRVMKVLKGYLVSEEALAFARNFGNMQNAAYCSQIFVLAFLQGVNVDPQASFDRYSPLLTLVAKVHPSIPEYFNPSERIVAPSGFAWQSRLVEKHVMIDLDTTTTVRNNAALLAPIRPRLTGTAVPHLSTLKGHPPELFDFIEDNF